MEFLSSGSRLLILRMALKDLLIVLALFVDVALILALEWQIVGFGSALVQGDQQVRTEITVAQRKTSILHFLLCGGHDVLVMVFWRGEDAIRLRRQKSCCGGRWEGADQITLISHNVLESARHSNYLSHKRNLTNHRIRPGNLPRYDCVHRYILRFYLPDAIYYFTAIKER